MIILGDVSGSEMSISDRRMSLGKPNHDNTLSKVNTDRGSYAPTTTKLLCSPVIQLSVSKHVDTYTYTLL